MTGCAYYFKLIILTIDYKITWKFKSLLQGVVLGVEPMTLALSCFANLAIFVISKLPLNK